MNLEEYLSKLHDMAERDRKRREPPTDHHDRG